MLGNTSKIIQSLNAIRGTELKGRILNVPREGFEPSTTRFLYA